MQIVRLGLIKVFTCILSWLYDANVEIFLKFDDSSRRGRDHKLFIKRFRLDVRKSAFSNRVINYWSSLSSQCINCCTMNTFKTSFS